MEVQLKGGGVQPIPTRYAGCYFRSRLEARWAVFFQTLGIAWEYEHEGFTLSDGTKYLPDFYLHDFDAWVEIKPPIQSNDVFGVSYANPSDEEKRKCSLLARESGKIVYIFFGCEPLGYRQLRQFTENDFGGEVRGSNLYFMPNGEWESCAAFGWSEKLRRFTLGPFGNQLRTTPYSNGSFWADPDDDESPDTDAPVLLKAYAAARSARFEHGESP